MDYSCIYMGNPSFRAGNPELDTIIYMFEVMVIIA